MSSSDWVSVLAVVEFAALVSIVLAVLLVWIVRRRRCDQSAADDLIARLRRGELERRAELQDQLTDAGLPETEAKQQALQLVGNEHRFHEQYLATYLDRDAGELRRLDERLRALLGPYLSLGRAASAVPAAATASAAAPEATADRGPELERLRQALRNLSEEMSLYRDTLNRVFSEYTAMFGVNLDPGRPLSASEIMQRLDTGELAGHAEPDSEAESSTGAEPPGG